MEKIGVWELLQKRMVWQQLGDFENKIILDFGSGNGVTAEHYARHNKVYAVEPNREFMPSSLSENVVQICGDIKQLTQFDDGFFDVIICHNVLEYAMEREEIVQQFARVLKSDGVLSIVKHNVVGRVMQMAVLLNNFDSANMLLDGKNGSAEKYGTINYYNDSDILKWSDKFKVEKILGQRVFWDLQQNQEIQQSEQWQKNMLGLEHRVQDIDEFRNIAFFHHLILRRIRNEDL
ncbi:MAG: class I SAM-dependent methyltransferase [Ruminococcus sp.]|nr:class I SAM-dependent methyltransferase [Ruminococcus sp.]